MKKRILTAVLAAALVTGTCAATVSAKEEKTYTIGICQLVQHDALDAATKGFEDAITEKMGDSVKFDEQNAQGDSNTCSTIINSFVSEGADLILANATASLLPELPISRSLEQPLPNMVSLSESMTLTEQ